MPLRAGGINFHFPYEAAPPGAPGGLASALPGVGASVGAAPARAHVCAAGCVCTCMCCMNVHTLIPVFVFASICTRMLANTGCKHIHTGACTCVIAIQVCNTGLQYRRAFACACNCLHVLATICTHFQCMHVSWLHTCTCNTCMLATHAHAFLQTCILATRACPCLHSCTLLQHMHACTLATHARACSHACNMRMSAHLHTPPPHAHAQCTHACGCTPACPHPPAVWSLRPPISGRPLIAAVPPRPRALTLKPTEGGRGAWPGGDDASSSGRGLLVIGRRRLIMLMPRARPGPAG